MNHLIAEIGSYPFDKLRKLLSTISPDKKKNPFINLSIGEPQKNSSPEVLRILNENKKLYSQYPPMDSISDLTSAYKHYLNKRFNLIKKQSQIKLNS